MQIIRQDKGQGKLAWPLAHTCGVLACAGRTLSPTDSLLRPHPCIADLAVPSNASEAHNGLVLNCSTPRGWPCHC